ncbi:hypothetical protein EAO75_14915, partial [Streptomyces sp. uw30]
MEPDRGRRRWLRLLPRTVRGRATVAVAAVASLALIACSAVLLYAVRTNLVNSAHKDARDQVEQAAHQLASGMPVAEVQAELPEVSTSVPRTSTTETPITGDQPADGGVGGSEVGKGLHHHQPRSGVDLGTDTAVCGLVTCDRRFGRRGPRDGGADFGQLGLYLRHRHAGSELVGCLLDLV